MCVVFLLMQFMFCKYLQSEDKSMSFQNQTGKFLIEMYIYNSTLS